MKTTEQEQERIERQDRNDEPDVAPIEDVKHDDNGK